MIKDFLVNMSSTDYKKPVPVDFLVNISSTD